MIYVWLQFYLKPQLHSESGFYLSHKLIDLT